MRKRTSIIWQKPTEEFAAIVAKCFTLTAIAKAVGAYPQAGTFRILKTRLREEKIDFSHIPLGLGSNKGRNRLLKKAVPLEEVMIEHSTYSRSALKQRLLKAGVLVNKCSICGLGSEWNKRPIRMRLDHQNGVYDDHRLDNLRMVCPNCDSQLPTFCNGNKAKYKCVDCKTRVSSKSKRCQKCSSKFFLGSGSKISWPSVEQVVKTVQESSWVETGKALGVSDNSVRKFLIKRGIDIKNLPPA
jgi:DNA-directed RNA polymerase subunit RPC12/RpoP